MTAPLAEPSGINVCTGASKPDMSSAPVPRLTLHPSATSMTIEPSTGHLHLYAERSVVAIYAPGSWLYAVRAE